MATIQAEARSIDNGNGHQLATCWYHPAETPRGTVLIAPAMAVKQDFYAHFASWLAERGLLAVTFDYLGMGQSRHVPLRQLNVDVLDWARHDCSAVLAKVVETAGSCRSIGLATVSARRSCRWCKVMSDLHVS